MTPDQVADVVLSVIKEKAALRDIHGYGPISVAYLMDIESGIPTNIKNAEIRRAVNRLKRRGIIKYRSRVGWVPVVEDQDSKVDHG